MYTEAMYLVYSKIWQDKSVIYGKIWQECLFYLFELLFISHFIHW